MPAKPVESRPGTPAVLHIQLTAELKNEIVATATTAGLSVTAWVTNMLYLAIRDAKQLPPPPPAVTPPPTPADTLLAYLRGDRLIGPCGQPWPCTAATTTHPVAGFTWCDCGIRLE